MEASNPNPHPHQSPTTTTTTSSSGPVFSPKPITRSEPNPYPTTFVQADTSSFKHVVQMLTGTPTTTTTSKSKPIPPIKPPSKSKLYERRNSLKNSLRITPKSGSGFCFGFGFGSSPRNNASSDVNLSPSILDFPALVLSPVTPLIPDPFNRSPGPGLVVDKAAEDKAIAEKGFFLHPSPRDSEQPPRLLPLFPLSSPRLSSGYHINTNNINNNDDTNSSSSS